MSKNAKEPIALGIADRIFLALTQAGHVRPVCQLVTYPNKDAAPSPQSLRARITQLGAIYPILSARIDASDPAHPHHVPTGILPQVHEWQHVPSEVPQVMAHDILDQVYDKAAKLDTVKGPLMRIDYITTPSSDQVFIALSADHFLADGAGQRTFLQLLLAPKLPELKKEPLYDTSIDKLIEMIPPPGPPPPESDIWPTNVPCPLDVPGAHAYFDYPVELIDKLKSIVKQHGVATLNPVLEVTFLAALISVAPTTDQFSLNTMRDDRKECGGDAPLWSSNYFSSPPSTFVPKPSSDFWEVTKAQAETLKDPNSIQAGRFALGGLAHVPIPLNQLLLSKIKSEHPYISSIFMTNMTYLDLPPGAEDFRWTSAATPFLCSVIVHWVGHKAGLRMSLAYRDGAGITKEQAGNIGEKVGALLDRLANRQNGSFEELANA